MLSKDSNLQHQVAPEPEEAIDVVGLIATLRRWIWLLVLCPMLTLVVAYSYLKRTTPLYEARAVLRIEDKMQVIPFQQVTADSEENDATASILANVNSQAFLLDVAEHEKLHENPGFIPDAAGAVTPEQAAAYLASLVTIKAREGSRLIDLYVRHPDPQVALSTADAVATGLIRFGMAQRAKATESANSFLFQESERLRKKLEASEMALQKYRSDNNAISLDGNENLVTARLKDLSDKLNAATAERVQLETDTTSANASEGREEELMKLKYFTSHPVVATVQQAIANKEAEIAAISQRYRAKHPKYLTALSELDNLLKQRERALQEARKLLGTALDTARANEEKFASALAEQEKKALELDELAIKYNALKREVETDKALYTSVVGRLKEVDITKGIDDLGMRIQNRAAVSSTPVWPQPMKMYGAAGAGGLLLAFGIVFGRFFADSSLRTVRQVEQKLGLPVLAAITRRRGFKRSPMMETVNEPQGAIAESFRSLRTMTSLLGRVEARRTVLITSALPSEGKTFCACNYAITLASQGLRTLLIDADLRRPNVSAALFGEIRKPGLVEHLIGGCGLEEAVHPTTVNHLFVLPAGQLAPNPAELLAAADFSSLLQEALLHYDRIVIDSAPVIAVSDSLLIAPCVDTALLVCRWGSTPMVTAQRASLQMRSSGKTASGVIFNQVPANSFSNYYHYHAVYYGSTGVYGAR